MRAVPFPELLAVRRLALVVGLAERGGLEVREQHLQVEHGARLEPVDHPDRQTDQPQVEPEVADQAGPQRLDDHVAAIGQPGPVDLAERTGRERLHVGQDHLAAAGAELLVQQALDVERLGGHVLVDPQVVDGVPALEDIGTQHHDLQKLHVDAAEPAEPVVQRQAEPLAVTGQVVPARPAEQREDPEQTVRPHQACLRNPSKYSMNVKTTMIR